MEGRNVAAFEDDLVAACGSETALDDAELIVANRNMLPLLLDLWAAAKADNISPILLQEALYHLEKTNV